MDSFPTVPTHSVILLPPPPEGHESRKQKIKKIITETKELNKKIKKNNFY